MNLGISGQYKWNAFLNVCSSLLDSYTDGTVSVGVSYVMLSYAMVWYGMHCTQTLTIIDW